VVGASVSRRTEQPKQNRSFTRVLWWLYVSQKVYCSTIVNPLGKESVRDGESMEKLLQRLDTLVRRRASAHASSWNCC